MKVGNWVSAPTVTRKGAPINDTCANKSGTLYVTLINRNISKICMMARQKTITTGVL